ncbi:hypothetical protein BYT27DRAFT_7248545 [Phlegmacium glaucopus]|nr:hypothetical protein BYT27DRAFT_7250480 [Phlegmacium glaucopus]KAF8816240.1 hypothetical protein BYT27DRAFT_7248545 [Phlegmacium glaucopus]
MFLPNCAPKGTEVSVWGTITFQAPNSTMFVLSSYSVDDGPATILNVSKQVAFQFQQKLFQSAPLSTSTPHTLVATLDNNATFFIDYFLITPVASSTSSPASSSSDSSTLSATSSLLTMSTASSSAQSHSSKVPLGPVSGGTLGGVALLIIAIIAVFAVWRSRKRLKDENQRLKTQTQAYADLLIAPTLPMQQYPPHASSDSASVYPIISAYTQHPTYPTTSTGSGVVPPSKAAQLSIPSRTPGDSLHSHSHTCSESPEPPGYNE